MDDHQEFEGKRKNPGGKESAKQRENTENFFSKSFYQPVGKGNPAMQTRCPSVRCKSRRYRALSRAPLCRRPFGGARSGSSAPPRALCVVSKQTTERAVAASSCRSAPARAVYSSSFSAPSSRCAARSSPFQPSAASLNRASAAVLCPVQHFCRRLCSSARVATQPGHWRS